MEGGFGASFDPRHVIAGALAYTLRFCCAPLSRVSTRFNAAPDHQPLKNSLQFNSARYIFTSMNTRKPSSARRDLALDEQLCFALYSTMIGINKAYRPLLKALQAGAERKDEAQKHLEAYLKGWYKGMKDCYWYNRHKGKFATHFGYWSFESGLVSVLCGLDDSAFRDMLYYPKDLVDYARAHPFEPLSEQRKQTLRALPGEPCPKTGDWYALHLGGKVVSLREGEPMPGPEYGPTGVVIWYLKG